MGNLWPSVYGGFELAAIGVSHPSRGNLWLDKSQTPTWLPGVAPGQFLNLDHAATGGLSQWVTCGLACSLSHCRLRIRGGNGQPLGFEPQEVARTPTAFVPRLRIWGGTGSR